MHRSAMQFMRRALSVTTHSAAAAECPSPAKGHISVRQRLPEQQSTGNSSELRLQHARESGYATDSCIGGRQCTLTRKAKLESSCGLEQPIWSARESGDGVENWCRSGKTQGTMACPARKKWTGMGLYGKIGGKYSLANNARSGMRGT